MTTGLELALALVPLVITATEHHKKAFRKAKMIASPKTRDENLLDFLLELHDEVALLGHTLRRLISDLTTLTEKQRELLLVLDREQWKQDDINVALRTRLGNDAENAFTSILDRLLKALDDVVSEKSLQFISSEKASSVGLFKKLEGFREEMKHGTTVQDLRTRFQFTTKEERRNKNLKKIRKCNEKLERFVHGRSSSVTSERHKSIMSRKTRPPTNRSRRLSQDAHKKISRCWSCPCSSPHEAKLSLLKCLAQNEGSDSAINLDLLVSMMSGEQPKEIWLESRIRILSGKHEKNGQTIVRFTDDPDPAQSVPVFKDPRRFLDTDSVCTFIKEAHKNNSSLELVFDGEKLWQGRPTGSRVHYKPEIGIPLDTLLGDAQTRLKLKESRVLAVVLAHAILHYCESPWVSNSWNKQHVSFFATLNGPDLMRPYLETQFEARTAPSDGVVDDLYSHPSPALLSLGILLLELYLSKPIESLWEADDTEDGMEGVNTNWITAEKQLEKMGDDLYEGYRNAIQACLKVDYVDSEDFSLDNESFRKLIYERVVIPLEDELDNGFHIRPEQLGVL
ncbi:hypothetical protein ONS95_012085 [Cadophora gregata]|uniref:uncharacterized protein n=1 Tax=Cadophora gregata TaxID=51156 RepID=UPI0026DC37AD|nr:uncharacterized protein ONS95_012085 [Cadophora gregata]KAK0117759.1 hypothetical protein ONS95_012085 [Cadophora gregata]KAK0122808.1 hypothetical protein ONS96_009842 [Cadophora gregata f. sp. sojae]